MESLKSIVKKIYNRAISLKDPAGWLAQSRAHFDGAAFVNVLFEEYKSMVRHAAQQAAVCISQRTNLWSQHGFEAEAMRSEAESTR